MFNVQGMTRHAVTNAHERPSLIRARRQVIGHWEMVIPDPATRIAAYYTNCG